MKKDKRALRDWLFVIPAGVAIAVSVWCACWCVYAHSIRPGDVDRDGRLTQRDIRMVQLHIMGIEQLNRTVRVAADANRDGEINARDLAWIAKRLDADKK